MMLALAKASEIVFKGTKGILPRKYFKVVKRNYSQSERIIILGIETSCDDTGCALVDSNGNVLGEALHSQHLVHLKYEKVK